MTGEPPDDKTNLNAIQSLNQIVIAIAALNKTVNAVFPQTIGSSGSATGGAATLPANPVGFLSVINPATGATIKIPYYT